jgi:hypothetical protein
MKLFSPSTPRARLLLFGFCACGIAALVPTVAATLYGHRLMQKTHDDTHLALTASAAEQLGAWLLEKGAALEAIAVGELWPVARNESVRPLALDYLQRNAVRALRLFRRNDPHYMELRLAPDFPPVALAATALADRLREAARSGLAVWTDGRTETLQLFAAVPVPEGVADRLGPLVLVAELDPSSLLRRFAAEARFRLVLFRDPTVPLVVADGHAIRSTEAVALPDAVTRWFRERSPASTEAPKSERVVTDGTAIRLGTFQRDERSYVAAVAPLPIGNFYLYGEYAEALALDAALALGTWTAIAGIAAMLAGFGWLLFGTGFLRKAYQQLETAIARLGAGDALPVAMPHPAIGTIYSRLQRAAQSIDERFRKVRTELEESRQARIELEQRVSSSASSSEDTTALATTRESKEKLVAAVRDATDEMKTPIMALLGRLERTVELVEAPSAPLEGRSEPHSMPKQLGDVLDEWSRELAARRPPSFAEWLLERRPGGTVPRVEEDVRAMSDLSAYWQRETRILLADLRFFRDQAEHLKRVAEKLRSKADSS